MDATRAELVSTGECGYRDVVLLGQNIDVNGPDMHPKRNLCRAAQVSS
jgi:hypothetical protein